MSILLFCPVSLLKLWQNYVSMKLRFPERKKLFPPLENPTVLYAVFQLYTPSPWKTAYATYTYTVQVYVPQNTSFFISLIKFGGISNNSISTQHDTPNPGTI